MVGALFNSSGEKLFLAVEVRFSTLLLPLPTNAYVFTVVAPFHPERRPKIWLRSQATAIVVVQCRKDLTKMSVCYVLVLSTDDLKKHEKVAASESWTFDSILGRCFPLVFDLEWPFAGHFSSRIPPIKYTKVLGNHLLYSFYYSLPLGSSLETSQELAERPTWMEEQWSFCSSLKLIPLFNSADRVYFCGDG